MICSQYTRAIQKMMLGSVNSDKIHTGNFIKQLYRVCFIRRQAFATYKLYSLLYRIFYSTPTYPYSIQAPL